MSEFPKVYDPHEVEDRLYRFWEEGGYFVAVPNSQRQPFTVVMPPPNITGVLHLGHGLDETLQDILVRFRRMQGYEALWVPGTDHAGIATQNVVERELAREGKTRQDLGREAFVERVWAWRERYGTQIIAQLKRLGCSCDWGRTRFTMDPGLSRAVRKVFVDLFNEGLIYRGNRIINWCPRCGTAIADVELDHSEYEGELVEFRYPVEGGSVDGGPAEVTVATTRLETMLGDTAIAVHPGDDRYAKLVGRHALHPFGERHLPIVADEAVDPAFGTGAVKVTPAHDQTDFEIAERHGIESINVFDGRARVNEAGGRFAGLGRYEAREAVRAALDELGLLVGSTPHAYAIARCARCNTIVEPWLSEQWFVRMEPLARPAIEAVESGRTSFYPERWTKYYLNWMHQIRDWCISRQLWWGHRIPIFSCDECGEVWAAEEDPEQCPKCETEHPHQDPDVLDTWFSSQLWPFSTLGWPDQTPDLASFYPTSALVTGYEIIHLWVARMIMSGLHFMGEVPFAWVYVHGIVRDAQGRKMSKSLGNVVDPLELMDRYGTDALRFMLAEHATGQDIFLHEEWTAGARNFANKLWNASRFAIMHLGDTPRDLDPPDLEHLSGTSRWILSRLDGTEVEVTACLESFDISLGARALQPYVWNEFCDWYLEMAKLTLREEGPEQQETRKVLRYVLEAILRLLHPFMPFVTEEIWRRMPGPAGEHPSIMRAPWPGPLRHLADADAEEDFERFRDVVSVIRSFRADHRVDANVKMHVHLSAADSSHLEVLNRQRAMISALAGVAHVSLDGDGLHNGMADGEGPATRLVAGPIDVLVPLAGVLDLDAERDRLRRALEKTGMEIRRLEGKLAGEQFRAKAPPEVVAGEERKLQEAQATEAKLRTQLSEIGG